MQLGDHRRPGRGTRPGRTARRRSPGSTGRRSSPRRAGTRHPAARGRSPARPLGGRVGQLHPGVVLRPGEHGRGRGLPGRREMPARGGPERSGEGGGFAGPELDTAAAQGESARCEGEGERLGPTTRTGRGPRSAAARIDSLRRSGRRRTRRWWPGRDGDAAAPKGIAVPSATAPPHHRSPGGSGRTSSVDGTSEEVGTVETFRSKRWRSHDARRRPSGCRPVIHGVGRPRRSDPAGVQQEQLFGQQVGQLHSGVGQCRAGQPDPGGQPRRQLVVVAVGPVRRPRPG